MEPRGPVEHRPVIKILPEGVCPPVKARHWTDRLSPWGEVPDRIFEVPHRKGL
jgi:hypothetical protein